VDVGTCWSWETVAATLPSARRRKAVRRPRGGEGRGHIVAAARIQLVLIIMKAAEGQGKSIIAYRKLQCSECIGFRFLSIPYVEGISDMYPLAPEPIRQTRPKPYHFFRWYGFVCKMPYYFSGLRGIYSPVSVDYLPRDAMCKRGLCCPPVSVRLCIRPSVTFVTIVSRRLKISSNFFSGW